MAKNPFKILNIIWRRMITKPLESFPCAPDIFFSYRCLQNHPELKRIPGGWFYKCKSYPDYLTVGGASCAIFTEACKYCSGHGVDIGAGLWPLPGAIPVDIWRGPGAGKLITDFADGSLDFIFSSHCLEHIINWEEALKLWAGKIKAGGVIFCYLPHPECAIWHPGSPFVGDGHKWIPTPDIIRAALSKNNCNIVNSNDGPDAMRSFYVCGRKRA